MIAPPACRSSPWGWLQPLHAAASGPLLGRLIETTAVTFDSREIPVEMAFSEAQVPEGSIFVGHLRDISARRAADAERSALEVQLRQAQKMEAIGQLTGGIAHDFNNILTSVLGYVAMAQERAQPQADSRLVHQLCQARLAAERARDLVAQMLTFARRAGSARRALALGRWLHESLGLLRATLPSSVVLEVDDIDAALPTVQADAVQLGQVLMNLVINARDAVDGAGHVRISIRPAAGGWRCRSCGHLATRGRWVELCVADDGSGIAPDTLTRMFDPFFSTKPPGRGTGMGLAMVHGIVHDHGGHIGVDTRIGEGSAFRILLPAAAEPALPTSAQAGEPAGSARAAALHGRALVVEDDPLAGEFLRERLEAWGVQVLLHADPREALARLESEHEHVDVLVTDLTMPHLSGLELARRGTALRPGLPVILVSADLAAADADARAQAGVSCALAKPIDVQALHHALAQALAAAPAAYG